MSLLEGTYPVLEVEAGTCNEPGVAARFVTWISWDSGFRGAGLKVGDLVVGHGDVRYTAEVVEKRQGVGDAYFSKWLEQKKAKPEDPLTLTVLRDGKEISVTGKIGGNRSYKNDAGQRILGDGGPVEFENDGLGYAWGAWYRQFVEDAKVCLSGWDYFAGVNTKGLMERLAPHAARVEFLEKKYPGGFAKAVREDYEAMKTLVAGEPRTLSAADTAYRTLGEARAGQVTLAADVAFKAFLEEVKDALMKDPPRAPDSFAEDTRALVGKIIQLPEVGRQQILFETRKSWYWAGSGSGGYLLNRQSEAMSRLFQGTSDYTEKVDPYFRDFKVVFVGVIQPEPTLVADSLRGITVSGLRVEPWAALVTNVSDSGRRLFTDLRPGKMAEPFAGAATLAAGIRRPVLRDDAGPGDVVMTAFEALKMGDIETWRNCYANWYVRTSYEKDRTFQYVDLTWEVMGHHSANSSWDQARKRLMDDVYGVEVARLGSVRTVFDASAQPGVIPAGGPRRVEEVLLFVNHIGKFGQEFRTFAGAMLKRRWELQRLDEGPWRITSTHSI